VPSNSCGLGTKDVPAHPWNVAEYSNDYKVTEVLNGRVSQKMSEVSVPVVFAAPTGLAAFNIGGTIIHPVPSLAYQMNMANQPITLACTKNS